MFFSVTLIIATLFVTDVHSQVGSALKEAPTVKPTVKKRLPKALVIYERKDLQESFIIIFSLSRERRGSGIDLDSRLPLNYEFFFYKTIKSIRIHVSSHNWHPMLI